MVFLSLIWYSSFSFLPKVKLHITLVLQQSLLQCEFFSYGSLSLEQKLFLIYKYPMMALKLTHDYLCLLSHCCQHLLVPCTLATLVGSVVWPLCINSPTTKTLETWDPYVLGSRLLHYTRDPYVQLLGNPRKVNTKKIYTNQ